jgi:hypothetical protein
MMDLYPAINEDFQKIVDKATQKDPNLRYQTCSEFLKDLNYNNPISTS